MTHIQESLSITDAEVSMVFERAQDIVLKPALEFLSLPVIRTQPVQAKIAYLQQKLGLHVSRPTQAIRRASFEISRAFRRDGLGCTPRHPGA